MFKKIDKCHHSDLDKTLETLRKEIPESPSQRRERQQYEKLMKLRDNPQQQAQDEGIWEDF